VAAGDLDIAIEPLIAFAILDQCVDLSKRHVIFGGKAY